MSLKFLIAVLALSVVVFAAPVSFEKASQVAENAAKSKKLSLKHKSFKKREARLMYAPAPDAAAPAVAEDALLYVFQNDNDKGFIIVSGDDVFSPIIGISDKGAYDPANLPLNFAWYIGNIEREMEFALENGQAQTQDIKDEWALYAAGAAYVVGDYLVKTQWNQRGPYWNQTPMINGVQTLTGCIATTMAQIMNYHKYPASTTGTIPAYTSRGGLSVSALPQVAFDWANIAQDYAVADLMNAAGRSVEMNYGTGESGAYSKDVPSALMKYFDYDYRVQYIDRDKATLDWVGLLKDQINDGLPVYYSGNGGNGNGGHAFVLDGYNSSNNFHINWGWGGNSDGFYAITVNSNSGLNPSPSPNGPYSYGQAAVINIKPSDSPGDNLVYKAANGGTYVLQADFVDADKLTGQLNIGEDFTLDLNGYTLTIEIPNGGDNGIKIASGKTFIIKDSRSGGILNVSNEEMTYVYPIGGSAAINTTDGTLIIESGTINAEGGRGAAGIGGGYGASGGEVIIIGGTVNAIGGYNGGAGIGGGAGGTVGGTRYNGGAGGNVAINGGMVTATGGNSSARGIGYGQNGSTGTLTMNGNALVFASSVGDASAKTSGILVSGSATSWYGNAEITLSPVQYTLPSGRTLTIPSGRTLKIPGDATLTVPSGATIANNGTVIPEDSSAIVINGTRIGNLIVGANVSDPALASEATLLANTGQTVEYAINTIATEPISGWQAETVFENFDEESKYYIFARSKANANFAAGASKMQIIKRIPKTTDLVFAIPDHIYTGTAQGIGQVTGTGMGAITVLYNGSAIIPINAGTYDVTVNVDGGEDFYAADGIALGDYEIKAKSVTVSGVTAMDRTYDSDITTVELTGGTLVGIVPDDDVVLILGIGTIDDADIGNGKAVTTNITLSGTDAGNYILTQPTDIKVNITEIEEIVPILSLQIAGISQATPMRIYNLQGKVLMTSSVAHLPKGVYIVKAGGKTAKVVK